uniref:Uncharacterized protein n=1 Tax=Physcomitrium patens TaxID=3218 RepID=A0A2K1INE4_PHYPA|nr:hypothetical protein PHYPA_027118 [Physcomitrium patens]
MPWQRTAAFLQRQGPSRRRRLELQGLKGTADRPRVPFSLSLSHHLSLSLQYKATLHTLSFTDDAATLRRLLDHYEASLAALT